MEFLDFVLKISPGAGGSYAVAVVTAPAGETTAPMRLAFDNQEIKRCLQAVTDARGAGVRTRKGIEPRRDLSATQQTNASPRDTVRAFGTNLFEALLPSEVRSCYRNSLNLARGQGKGLRIRLRIDAPELAVLPWEYTYDNLEREYICLARETPVIRYLELARPTQPLTIRPPLRILGMVASPTDLPQLDIGREKQQMAEAIQHLVDAGQVSLTWIEGPGWRDMQKAMRGGPWHVFHFIGHGDFEATQQEGQIALVDEEGQTKLLSATQLGRLLASHASLRLVVLNSCDGALASEMDLFSSTGAVLTGRGIPAVVSMQDAITDRSALEFSRSFYEVIAEGLPVDAAVTEARIAISMAMNDTLEWGTPVLHMRADNGCLFDINAAGAIFPETDKKVVPELPVAKPDWASTPPRLGGELQRGLAIMRRKVQQFWVEGVLENSLSHSGLIDLEFDTLPDKVDSPWGSMALDPRQPISTLCDELGGSFLILGVPGAGKTTIMLSLVRELILRAEIDPGLPIPVVFNLSSWIDRAQSLLDWLVSELSGKYGIPKKMGHSWLEQSQLRLFLDGLDEVSTLRRAACVQAINEFARERSMTGVVVCCRFNEYIDLPLRLTLNGAIRLRTLTRDRVASYLETTGTRLASLRILLQRDSSLQVLAQTPFVLSMMIRTYQDMPPDELDDAQFASVEARKRQLMDAYVERQFRVAFQGGARG
jgi:CHAT domain/NACHT domain